MGQLAILVDLLQVHVEKLKLGVRVRLGGMLGSLLLLLFEVLAFWF